MGYLPGAVGRHWRFIPRQRQCSAADERAGSGNPLQILAIPLPGMYPGAALCFSVRRQVVPLVQCVRLTCIPGGAPSSVPGASHHSADGFAAAAAAIIVVAVHF